MASRGRLPKLLARDRLTQGVEVGRGEDGVAIDLRVVVEYGLNLAVVEQLEAVEPVGRAAVAREVTRAALMGARGNSGVIFSQIVRGAAEVLGEAEAVDAPSVAHAFRGASDAAYRAVRRPVEGTMLTVIRELAEEAESARVTPVPELFPVLIRRGEEAVARTPELLEVLREAGVGDAGGGCLLELVRW